MDKEVLVDIINLAVSGMTCISCVKHVEKALNSITGVEKVSVDLASGLVSIEGNLPQGASVLVDALNEEGYPATVSPKELVKTQAKSNSCKSTGGCCCN